MAGEGEVIAAQLALGSYEGQLVLQLTLDRPAAIACIGERDLLDPGYSPDGDWPSAPALGLGFALRLVRNLADTVGGALTIAARQFVLHLPAAAARTDAERDQGRG